MMKDNLKHHMGYWLNRARMTVHQAFEDRLSAYDITVAQWCILVSLYDEQASAIKELADHIDVDKASISRVVNRLVAKGLVTHTVGKDRRSGHLQLGAEGLALVPQLMKEAEQNEQTFFGDLNKQDQDLLRHVLHKICCIKFT